MKKQFVMVIGLCLTLFHDFLFLPVQSMDSCESNEQERIILSGHTAIKLKNNFFACISDLGNNQDQSVQIVDEHQMKAVREFWASRTLFHKLFELKSGKFVCAISDNHHLKIIDQKTGRINHVVSDLGWINSLIELADGNIALSSIPYDFQRWSIKIINPETGKCIKTIPNCGARVGKLIQLENGDIVAGCDDGCLRIWNYLQEEVRVLGGRHKGNIFDVKILTTGQLATASADGTIGLWDLESEKLVKKLKGHQRDVLSLTVLQENRLASTSWDNSIKIWDVLTGELLTTFTGHINGTSVVTELKSGRIASGSKSCRDDSIKIWNPQTGELVKILKGHTMSIISLFELDNGNLVSSSYDRTVRVWKCAW